MKYNKYFKYRKLKNWLEVPDNDHKGQVYKLTRFLISLEKIELRIKTIIARQFSGKTSDFGSEVAGSSPALAAISRVKNEG